MDKETDLDKSMDKETDLSIDKLLKELQSYTDNQIEKSEIPSKIELLKNEKKKKNWMKVLQ